MLQVFVSALLLLSGPSYIFIPDPKPLQPLGTPEEFLQ